MLSNRASLLLSLDGVVLLGNLVATSLDLLLGSLALLSRSLAVVVLDSGLLSALLGGSLVLGLGSGDWGVCSVSTVTVSIAQTLFLARTRDSTHLRPRPQRQPEPWRRASS